MFIITDNTRRHHQVLVIFFQGRGELWKITHKHLGGLIIHYYSNIRFYFRKVLYNQT